MTKIIGLTDNGFERLIANVVNGEVVYDPLGVCDNKYGGFEIRVHDLPKELAVLLVKEDQL